MDKVTNKIVSSVLELVDECINRGEVLFIDKVTYKVMCP